MLVLTRKAGEAILIGDSVRVKVLEIAGGRVRIGIEAPADVRIHREEVADRHRIFPRAMTLAVA